MNARGSVSDTPRLLPVLLLIALVSLVVIPATRAQEEARPQHAQVTILATTDLHGNILPVDYYTNKPDARGLARAATIIRSVRKENPEALLVDSGDTIQGTPLEYFHNKKNNRPPDPLMLAMNALRYDAMTVGNHEYNFGPVVMAKARFEANFPWLSANTYRRGTEQTFFKPYIVKDVSGVRVGILGLTTPGIPSWENVENYSGLEFREPIGEARKWVAVLRDKESVDLVIIAMHMGLERDLRTGEFSPGQVENENMAIAIAEQVSGVDVILMGHTHREVPSLYVNRNFATRRVPISSGLHIESPSPSYFNGVLLSQSSNWARSVARVDIYLDRDSTGKWQVSAKQARTIPVTDAVEADAEILRLVEPYDRETQGWLSQVVGASATRRFSTSSIACSWRRGKPTFRWPRVSTRRRASRKAPSPSARSPLFTSTRIRSSSSKSRDSS